MQTVRYAQNQVILQFCIYSRTIRVRCQNLNIVSAFREDIKYTFELILSIITTKTVKNS